MKPSADLSLVALPAITLGLLEAALIATARLGAARAFQHVPPGTWFIVPLCWVAAAIVLAIPSYAIARRRGGAVTVIALLALFFAARLFSLPLRTIVIGAIVMLIASAIAWIVAMRWIAAPKRIAAGIAAVALVALIIGAFMTRERDRAVSSAPRNARPDVVVAFLDTVPYDSMFASGTELPFFSRLAAQSVVFDRAYTPSPWTLPAHFSAVTGLPAHRIDIGFDQQQYGGHAATLAQRFQRRGYRTAAVLSNTFLNRGTGFARGFEVYDHASNGLTVCRSAPGFLLDLWWPGFAAGVCNWTASEVTERAIAHIPPSDQPLFLLLNYMDAHDPYYVERDCPRPSASDARSEHLAALRCIDRSLGKLSAELARRNRPAVFVIAGDHGEQFGEHGLHRHGNSVYRQLLHVPFVIHAPGLAPRRFAEPVSIASLPRFVLDVVDGRELRVTGQTIVSSLVPPAALADHVEQWSLISERWHLIRKKDELTLYDVVADPAEVKKISAPEIVRRLTIELEREQRNRTEPRLDNFRSLGYIQ